VELVGIAGGKILARPGGNSIEAFGEEIHDHEKALTVYDPPYAITMNWASRLSLLRTLNLFDENFIRCEDVDLSQRILASGYQFAFCAEAICYHHNESSLKGLFREGFAHGFYSVQVLKKHRKLTQRLQRKQIQIAAYVKILKSFKDYLVGHDRERSICYFAFNLGKKLGKICGSMRFGYVEL
jgi:GT2 family glycosyltransferase